MRTLILIGISSFILLGCNNPAEKVAIVEDTIVETEHHHHDDGEAIALNNGEKWMINDEMRPFLQQGSELIDTYIQEGQTDYKELAQLVRDQNNELIKSCTMKGESHDELHKWLHPHLELTQELDNETDQDKANQLISQLQESYKQFHEYFK